MKDKLDLNLWSGLLTRPLSKPNSPVPTTLFMSPSQFKYVSNVWRSGDMKKDLESFEDALKKNVLVNSKNT